MDRGEDGMIKSDLRGLREEITNSIQFVAAEYKYAKDLQVQLQRIDNEPIEKAIADARKGFRILRWVQRGERKAFQSEEKIGQLIREVEKQLPESMKERAKNLETTLITVQKQILRAVERYSGELDTELSTIITEEQLLQKLEAGGAVKIRSQLGALCTGAKANVEKLLQWVASIEEVLHEIKGFELKLEEVTS